MKKVISLMLAATMMFGICACGPTSTTAPAGTTDSTPSAGTTATSGTTAGTTVNPFLVPSGNGFDDKNIVLQFAAVSDVHVARNAAAQGRVQSAFEQLKEAALLYTDKGLDAVVIAGDLTDDYGSNQDVKAGEIQKLKTAYENVFGTTPTVPMIYGLGNHDHDFERAGGAGSDLATFINVMGNKDVHTKYDVACSDSAHGSRHSVIGNYHFLFLEPITYGCTGADDTGAKYYAETKAWLDAELKAITEANPNNYVFVVTHPMIYGTVYGSELLTSGIYWYTKDITDILSKYPQAVTFGGHLHFPLNDERSIMQTAFTALGCGSVQYMALEDGGYDGMASATTMPDNQQVSSGYLVQVDASGNVRFIRMDFQNKTTIKDPFIIEAPKADKSHLEKYSKNRANTNATPTLSPDAITIKDNSSDPKADVLNVEIEFLAGTDDDVIHHYLLEVKEKGVVIETHKILTDFYRHGQPSGMKKTYNVLLTESFARGANYDICLTAYDSWDAASTTVVKAYAPVLDMSNVTLPDPYADINFASGAATDAKGNVSVTLEGGAKVEDGSYTIDGVTKTLTGLNIKGEGYAKVTFDKFNNFTIGDLLKKEIAIELLYVNRSKTGKQELFSSYNKTGFGVYEEAGKPTFTNKFPKEFKTLAAKEATYANELVHVIVTYSANTSLYAVYVNGERTATKASGYSQINCNIFAIGANYGEGTVGASAKDLSVVDVKIYTEKFSQAQAIVRYQKVLEEYKK
jgi:Icc-related predicted phosphoesterase